MFLGAPPWDAVSLRCRPNNVPPRDRVGRSPSLYKSGVSACMSGTIRRLQPHNFFLVAFALARHTRPSQLTAQMQTAPTGGKKGEKGRQRAADLHTTRSWTWQSAPYHRQAPHVAKAASILPTPAPGHISWIRRAGTRRASSSHGCRAQSNDLSLIDAAMARSSRTDLCAIVHVVREYDGVGA